MKNKRLFYGIAFAVLVIIEFIIGIFVHDGFIRPYLGDIIVVIAIYLIAKDNHIVDIIGIQNHFLRVLIGTSFDWKDILCYAVGCLILGIYEIVLRKNKK